MKQNQSKINLSYKFYPLTELQYTISSIMGNFNADLVKLFFSKKIAKRVNIIASELINNVIENTKDKKSFFIVNIYSLEDELTIIIKNKTSENQYNFVRNHIKKINKNSNPKKLLAETIKIRREKGLTGGLGLIRVVSEEKARLQVRYNKKSSMLSVVAKLHLEKE